MPRPGSEPVEIEKAEYLGKGKAAALFKIEDKEVWLPFSAFHEENEFDYETAERGDIGTIVIQKWLAYMVKTSRGNLYTGISKNIEKRVETHNKGRGAKCLLGQLPVELVWATGPMTQSLAIQLELGIKEMSHTDKVNLIGKEPQQEVA